ncbi:uncharacterized protein LOC131237356 [Magnolia sinica]|uniref:uncharacterized protein LOC131237356 n=1 Tax=Magnolia sinica TaxID=86752 RepID=UPI0026582C53|nr:uncharacterized protein LOC131237356 [Magnolia sinica]
MTDSKDLHQSSSSSSALEWQKIFNALVQMLQSQQSQVETLAKDRQLLQDRIHIQHQHWLSDVRLLQDHLCQAKSSLMEADMGRTLEAVKSDLVVGMVQGEAFFYKMKSERSGSDLEDLQQVVDYLGRKLSEREEKSELSIQGMDKRKGGDKDLKTGRNAKEEDKRTKTLQEEIRRLKSANEKLNSQKSAEISALLAERNFVWNQFKRMESDYTNLLKSKRIEVEHANESIEKIQLSVETLQSSNKEKDEAIFKLKADLAKHKMELESLRSSRKIVASCPRMDSTSFSLKNTTNSGRQKRHLLNNKPDGSQPSNSAKSVEQGSKRSSKMRGTEAVSMSGTPRLFSSSFKVPKLKISCSPHRV